MNKNKDKNDLSRYAQKMLRDIIVDLDEKGVSRGLGVTIVEFDPVPDESNNWLKHPDKEEVSGTFKDDMGRTHEFLIKREKGEWTTVTKIIKDTETNNEDVAEEVLEPVGEAIELNACPICATMEEEPEYKGSLNEMEAELKALRAELNSYKAEKEAEKLGELVSYARTYYSEGFINPEVLPQASFESILTAAYDYDKKGVAVYSEGANQIGLVDTIKVLISAIRPTKEEFSDKPVITGAITNSDELPTEVHADMSVEQRVEVYLESNGLDRSLTNLHRAYTYARYGA